MPESFPRSTWAVIVVPDVSFAPSAGSMILNANACCARGLGTGQLRRGQWSEPTCDVSRLTFHVSRLSLQVEGHVDQDDAIFEQQRSLEEQCALVVQEALPPMGGENLWDHDGHPDVRFLFEDLFDVVEQRSQDGAIGRGEGE